MDGLFASEDTPFETSLLMLKEQIGVSIQHALYKYVPAVPDSYLHEAMSYATLAGGKRLRAFLLFAAAGSTGNDFDPDTALQAATSLEILHTYSLVHDDLPAMDNDDYRRGQLTVHKYYDEATAILVGDALQTLAFQMLVDQSIIYSPALQCELVRLLAQASGAGGMVLGQHLDLISEKKPSEVQTFEQIRSIQQSKTGALITASCQMGAAIASMPEEERQALTIYGDAIGLAFQIKDDLLDITSNRTILGKETHKDEKRGKATFVSLEGEKGATQRLDQLVQIACEVVNSFSNPDLLQQCALFIAKRQS
jgi:geranylgeranyl pyrophosphate synthase